MELAQLLGLAKLIFYIIYAIGCKLCSKESSNRPLYPVPLAFTCFVAYLELYVSGRDNLVCAFGDFGRFLSSFGHFQLTAWQRNQTFSRSDSKGHDPQVGEEIRPINTESHDTFLMNLYSFGLEVLS